MPFTKTIRALAFTIAVLPVLAACDVDLTEEKPVTAAPARPPVAVSTVTAAAEDIPVVNELPGRIAPTNIAEVRPRVSGLVVKRVFEQGTIVNQGDVLYKIDPAPFEVQVQSARATLKRALATQEQAKRTADRQQELQSRKVASAQTRDDAVAALAKADADVALARAGLAAAELDLHYTNVKAPISGRIGRALITEGALVGNTSTESLAVIRQLDPVYADFTQSAKELRELRKAMNGGEVSVSADGAAAVHLLYDDGAPYPQSGRLLLQESTVDSTTGQITLRGEFPNPDTALLPGMYVRVRIEQGIRHNAIAVPQQAIQRDTAGKARLYVVAPDGTLELRQVVLGEATGNRWVVESGLAVGEQIVVEGFQKIRPGAKVTPQPWQQAANSSAQ
ncbi:efflux RND transporter periplasmic adaptor subunit [Nisaea denitrificans]|uniref:efflux RND transporter periplasmic adaptor subunit n=1 Tax=Nisaea denitrificans TaxID=390877 RepID=UPI00041A0403|nr:efflux RND transporter periplasmic adaptor subunit [Nisaea denitrificans]